MRQLLFLRCVESPYEADVSEAFSDELQEAWIADLTGASGGSRPLQDRRRIDRARLDPLDKVVFDRGGPLFIGRLVALRIEPKTGDVFEVDVVEIRFRGEWFALGPTEPATLRLRLLIRLDLADGLLDDALGLGVVHRPLPSEKRRLDLVFEDRGLLGLHGGDVIDHQGEALGGSSRKRLVYRLLSDAKFRRDGLFRVALGPERPRLLLAGLGDLLCRSRAVPNRLRITGISF